MPYDEDLAARFRAAIGDDPRLSERKMFGGICFMFYGNMACGIVRSDIMVRVGPDAYDDALNRPYTRPMDFTGRPMKGMVYVDAPASPTTLLLATGSSAAVRRVATAKS